jgi:hypothetical protein
LNHLRMFPLTPRRVINFCQTTKISNVFPEFPGGIYGGLFRKGLNP